MASPLRLPLLISSRARYISRLRAPMRLYRALGIPRTTTDRQISESYQSAVRKTAGTSDMSAVDESYLTLLDGRKRYLYDIFGDIIVDVLQDRQACIRVVEALDPANILLLVDEQSCTLSLIKSIFLTVIAVFDTRILSFALRRAQSSLKHCLSA